MARPLRIEFEGALYHVTSRGNAGTEIFIDDVDRMRFLETLGNTIERYGWICYAYCLMTNHYHLLIETSQPNLSRGMQHLNGVYTQWFNRQHSRFGHLVQGRFKSIVVEKESYLLELARYIVLNPVRAKMVRSARDWRWSSYRATAGQVKPPEFLKTNWLLSQFGANYETATRAYRDFVKQGRDVDVWKDVTAGVLMGGESFVQSMRPLLRDIEENREIRREERLVTRPSLEELFPNVTDKATRNERIHVAVRKYLYKLQEVGDHLDLCYSTISVIAKRVDESNKP
ncbi:transposase [Candidatus Bipolaricaulota bacterium]|nr:transposase [Candidatus Bipolaricaulota bacterium]